jgi:hypothetical protein
MDEPVATQKVNVDNDASQNAPTLGKNVTLKSILSSLTFNFAQRSWK